MSKVHKVDYDAGDFLGGVTGMQAFDIGVYWVICSLQIEDDGASVHIDDERIYRIIRSRPSDIRKSIARLCTIQKGRKKPKFARIGDEVQNSRASFEVEKAAGRIAKAQENAPKGGRPRKSGDIKASPTGGESGANPAPMWDQSGAILSQTRSEVDMGASGSQHGIEQNQGVKKPDGFISEKLLPSPSPSPSPLETPISPPRRKPTATKVGEPKSFADWYDAYPSSPHNVRARAVKAYAAAMRDGVDPDRLLRSTRRYARNRQDEDQKYTPGAAKWLADRAWEKPENAPEFSEDENRDRERLTLYANYLRTGTWYRTAEPIDSIPEAIRERAQSIVDREQVEAAGQASFALAG